MDKTTKLMIFVSQLRSALDMLDKELKKLGEVIA